MRTPQEHEFITLFEQWAGEPPEAISPLPQSGSDREYYRIVGQSCTAIGAFNPDRKENVAFLEFSKHFHQKGLPVPEVYAEDIEHNVYLVQDLGVTTLFAYLTEMRRNRTFPGELLTVYKKALAQLPKFQILAGQDLNYNLCYPRASFDRQSMFWDLNYFKYYFLKLAKIPYDEQLLEDDFQSLTEFLLAADSNFFLYRDFQSRNIMLYEGEPYFIDYQGGRRGALQYDLASLLYDSKADLPAEIRTELLAHYLDIIQNYLNVDKQEFTNYFYGYVLIRIMQAMGSYGFRGFYEKRTHFLQSIPYALDNLQWILEHVTLPVELPMLTTVFHQLVHSERLRQMGAKHQRLQVRVNSFSFMRGIPNDQFGHGGGFVFDCRGLNNPGRYVQYQHLTGKDAEVIDFLECEETVAHFVDHACALVDLTVKNYIQRNRTHLMINFGCTGGQHRSVYCAERMAEYLRKRYDVELVLHHIEQEL